MKLYVMFGQREESYPGQHGPEALDFVWDEYCVDENPDGFEQACKEAEEKAKKDGFLRTKLIVVNVNGDKISKLLNEPPTIEGTVES